MELRAGQSIEPAEHARSMAAHQRAVQAAFGQVAGAFGLRRSRGQH
jgi:hypothetical protein